MSITWALGLPGFYTEFLAGDFRIQSVTLLRAGQRHSLGRLGKREGGADCTMGVDAVLANAIGIEAESTKCVGSSEAGLAADSPGRRHCLNH